MQLAVAYRMRKTLLIWFVIARHNESDEASNAPMYAKIRQHQRPGRNTRKNLLQKVFSETGCAMIPAYRKSLGESVVELLDEGLWRHNAKRQYLAQDWAPLKPVLASCRHVVVCPGISPQRQVAHMMAAS